MSSVKLVDIKSRKKRMELLLSHGEKVPRYIGDLGFDLGFSMVPEEKRQFLDFVSKITGKSLDSRLLHPDVVHKEIFSSGLLDEVSQSGMLNGFSDLEQEKIYKYLLDSAEHHAFNENNLFDTLNNSQKEKIYEYLAGLILRFVKEHNLTIIKPQNIGTVTEVQVGLLAKIKEQLGSEAQKYLFAIEQDWIFGYPELASPRFDFFMDRPDDMILFAEFKLALGRKITQELLEQLDKRGIRTDIVISGSDICIDTGTYKPSWIMDKFVYPYLKREVEMFRELGIRYVIKHTDGNLLVKDREGKTCLEKLIDCGIDALHAIDPYCMDIKKLKEIVLDKKTGLPKICIIGGIDTIGATLFDGSINFTEEDFVNHVWHCLEEGSINGGYIPGATNDISSPGGGEKARKRYRIFCEIKKQFAKHSINKQGVARIKRPK